MNVATVQAAAWYARSEQIDEWASAYVDATIELVEVVASEQAVVEMRGGGQYRYNYADLGAVMSSVRPVLARHGLAVTQSVETSGPEVIVWTTLLHRSSQYVTFAPLTMHAGDISPQSAGSAITYGRRYSVLAALGLASTDDDGGAATSATRRADPEPVDPDKVRISREQLDEFNALKAQLGSLQKTALRAWFSAHKVPNIEKASRVQAAAAIDAARAYLSDVPEDVRADPKPEGE